MAADRRLDPPRLSVLLGVPLPVIAYHCRVLRGAGFFSPSEE